MNEPDLEQQSDWALLDQYLVVGSEEAFAALVHRHLNLVYAVALRHCGDAGMAEEVANDVSCILARKARTLKKDIAVPGWLFKTARYAASNARKFQRRRQEWERQAAESEGCFPDSTAAEGEVAKAWELIAK